MLKGDIAAKFFVAVLNLPQVRKLLSAEHFSVDGTLIEAWASMKSFVPKDGGDPPSGKDQGGRGGRNSERDFHGQKRKNDTHFSTTDPDARLFRKGVGKEAKLCHMGHLMMENRNGLLVDARLSEANGTAERAAQSAATKPTTRPTLSPAAASAGARRMSRRTTLTAGRRSMHAPPAIPGIGSAPSSGNKSKNPSGGSKRSAACARRGIAAAAWSSGSSC
jgi:hypothetical protein